MSHKLKIGDTVRLSASALRHNHSLLEEKDFPWAIIVGRSDLLGPDVFELNRELAGSCFWCPPDILLLKRGVEKWAANPQRLPLKLTKGFYPSNFTPQQSESLKRIEEAIVIFESLPTRKRAERKLAKMHLNVRYNIVCDLGIEDALTPLELSIINKTK